MLQFLDSLERMNYHSNYLYSRERMNGITMRELIDPSALGKTIREERIRQGLTQDELAQLSGVGINFVSQVERGKPTAETGKVFSLLRMLGITVIVERRREWKRISKSIESDENALC